MVITRTLTAIPGDSLPVCGCFGHDTSAANPARPCEPCGLQHALTCPARP